MTIQEAIKSGKPFRRPDRIRKELPEHIQHRKYGSLEGWLILKNGELKENVSMTNGMKINYAVELSLGEVLTTDDWEIQCDGAPQSAISNESAFT